MAKNKKNTPVLETLSDFLFSQIKKDTEYRVFRDTPLPNYITDNIHPSKKLRKYQEEAVKHFIWYWESGDIERCKSLLFNMATGTGKTLVMACCMLFLYEKWYRNYIFLVHQIQILSQAKRNFTDYKFEKYLFNPDTINFYGNDVRTREITTFEESNENDINIMFLSTSLFYNRVKEDGENRLCQEDFEKNNVIIIADEAHRLNVETRSNKSEEDEETLNWESAVKWAIGARKENILIEFTATVDLANKNIHEKYKDKLIFKYDFYDFNRAGYCKDVQFLYNNETQVEDQKKLLIVHAVVLSQYRKVLFRELVKAQINPVILIKSKRIADSESDREYFNTVISELKSSDFEKLRNVSHDEYGILSNIFWELAERGYSEARLIWEIREEFAPQHTIIYNSKQKEKPEMLSNLDNPKNTIRAIFSVNALNEWWDVLSLYDIIHFDIWADKKVSLQDIQLIGRWARYCPFELPETFQDGLFWSYDTERDRRKFDKARTENARILESFYYHFVKTWLFLENLQKELMGEGIISEWVEKRTVRMKPSFLSSDTYRKWFVLINKTEKRQKTTESEKEETFDKIITISSYELLARWLTDREENQNLAEQKVWEISILTDFSIHILRKALVRAENGFFRFENLRNHIVDLESIDEFITNHLSRYTIKFMYEKGKEISSLSPIEKLQLLIGAILPEVRTHIDMTLPKIVWSKEFRPRSISHTFSKSKDLYFASYPTMNPETGKLEFARHDERMRPQTGNEKWELALDISTQSWYAYDENYWTNEEKKFVKFLHSKIESLKTKYPSCEIYCVRNELEYWMYSFSNGKRFSPDYMMFINDTENKKLYYQCVFEVKWSHLEEKDEWKEKALREINEGTKISFDSDSEDSKEYKEYLTTLSHNQHSSIENIWFWFYNSEWKEWEFIREFDNCLL